MDGPSPTSVVRPRHTTGEVLQRTHTEIRLEETREEREKAALLAAKEEKNLGWKRDLLKMDSSTRMTVMKSRSPKSFSPKT